MCDKNDTHIDIHNVNIICVYITISLSLSLFKVKLQGSNFEIKHITDCRVSFSLCFQSSPLIVYD